MDKSKLTYNSHVTLSQGLMRSYSEKRDGQIVHYLDIASNKVKQEKMRLLDAEEKYYELEIEEYLDTCIENGFFTVSNQLYKYNKKSEGNIQAIVTTRALQKIRDFFRYSFLRNKSMYNQVLSSSDILPLVSGFTHGVMLATADAVAAQFANRHISILLNKTAKGFVCPHGIIYYVYGEVSGNFVFVISASKDIAFCLNMEKCDNNVDIIEVCDNDCVTMLNLAAYESEKNHDSPFIVGKLDDLSSLQSDYETIEPLLADGKRPITINI